jgi:hypothetical protein
MQGKSALERIYQDITSSLFPVDAELAKRFLADRYLLRAKSSLIRNFAVVLIKKHIGPTGERNIDAFSLALEACLRIRRVECESVLQELLPKLASNTPADRLLNVLVLADIEPSSWNWCGEPTRILVRAILKSGKQHEHYTHRILAGASKILDLTPLLTEGYEKLDDAQKLRLAELSPRSEYIKPMLSRFARSSSYREAGSIGQRAIAPLSRVMSAEDVLELIQVVRSNGQIYLAETPDALNIIFDSTVSHLNKTGEAWMAFVEERTQKEGKPTDRFAYPELRRRLEQYNLSK